MTIHATRWLAMIVAPLLLGACTTTMERPPVDSADAKPAEGEALRFEDAITLRNASATLTVVPSIGRVMGFGPAGGPELMWHTTAAEAAAQAEADAWVNYGGDKMWPAMQEAWRRFLPHGENWPPDPAIDGVAWEVVALSERRVVIRSPFVPQLGVRVSREIDLDKRVARVVIRNHIERVERSPFPVCIWSVSQVKPPMYVLMGVEQTHPQGPHGAELHAIWGRWAEDKVGDHITPLAGKRALRWDLVHEGDAKVGTLGTWCAGVYDGWALVQQTAYEPTGSYPDASSIQAYTHGPYLELETLSPQSHPQPGEAIENTVVWTLLPVDGRDDAALVEAIEALPGVAGK